MQRIYFDHNATTPIDPAVIEKMTAALREEYGNPSSVHHFGQSAKAALDEARTAVATLIGGEPAEVVFMSGGTEGDNFAIRGVAEALEPSGKRHLIASAIEHEAVLNTLKALARRGWRTTLLPVDQTGIVEPDRLRDALADDTALVSVMHANNEIGTIQPVAELARLAHERGVLFHTDAVQSAGKIPVNVKTLGVDLLTLSAHKFYGPKGIGRHWIRRGLRLLPILTGGKHERSRRAGTENVAGIVGMGVAAQQARAKMAGEALRLAPLRDRLENGIVRAVSGTAVNGVRAAASAQYDEHQLRSRRSRVAADCARPGRRRRVNRVRLLVRHAGTVARAQGDGVPRAPDAELNPVQPRRRQHGRGRRSRDCRPAGYRRETEKPDADTGPRMTQYVSVARSP